MWNVADWTPQTGRNKASQAATNGCFQCQRHIEDVPYRTECRCELQATLVGSDNIVSGRGTGAQ